MAEEPKTQNTGAPQPKAGMQEGSDEPVLGQHVQDVIGRSLQAHFDDIASAPIPDKFLVLLAELEAKEAGRDN